MKVFNKLCTMSNNQVKITLKNLSIFKEMKEVKEDQLLKYSKVLVPALLDSKHKGQAGRIGVIGGSLEYTGAPYFSAISALRVGADLSHVFCTKDAAPVIKSYSPELIVHPLLDFEDAVDKIKPWFHRLHVIVIGPGLGRDHNTLETVSKLINVCRELEKPLVIDADGLYLISEKPQLLHGYKNVIMTPNANEFPHLIYKDDEGNITEETLNRSVQEFGDRCVILRKGMEDEMFGLRNFATCNVRGSARRCGGQGDMLSGSLAIFYSWALNNENIKRDLKSFVACYAACRLTRVCNAEAFKKKGRSMLCSDMIEEIGVVFSREFECNKFN